MLAGLVAAAVGGPLLSSAASGTAYATSADDLYNSNTDLYHSFLSSPDPADGEGKDFQRRFKRHQIEDTSKDGHPPYMLTTILAIHGGGIEVGTSELCMGIAGYDPESGAVWKPYPGLAAGEPVYDFWMFEGMRSSRNSELHVTSIHCDDHMAVSMAASSMNTLSIHGLKWEQAYPKYATNPDGLPDKKGVVVGGRDGYFREILTTRLRNAGFQIFPGTGDVNGDEELNICNRTMSKQGAQLELTRELRDSFFSPTADSPAARAASCKENASYKKFVQACRAAIVEREQLQRVEVFIGA
ncbi:phage replication protein [Streptomyces sp. WAC06614]|nr:phage replication protein [Streptomyces sp. WAC06614]